MSRRVCAWVGLVWLLVTGAASGQPSSQTQLLQDGLRLLETRGEVRTALSRFEQAARGPDRAVAARATLYVGVASERLGQERARLEYERVLRDFADQPDVVAEARRRLAALRSHMRARPLSLTLRPALPRLPPDVAWLGPLASDGRRFAFLGGDGRVRLADSSTGAPLSVASRPIAAAPAGPAAASPDGARVAVAREDDDGTASVAIEGQGPPAVVLRTDAGATISNLDWPLPGTLVCQIDRADGTAVAVLVSVSRRTVHASIPVHTYTTRLALSRDGRWLVFDGPSPSRPGGSDVMAADVSTGDVTTLLTDATQPAWTTDGRHLLFLSRRAGSTGLWAQPMAEGRTAGDPVLVGQDLGRVFGVLGVTMDAYFYLRQVGLVDVYTVPLGADGMPTGPPQSASGTFVGSNMGPAFSPDGRTLAFLTEMGFGSREAVGLRTVATGEYRSVATDLRYLRTPRWSPDGSRLLVKGTDAGGRHGFHVIDVRTGAAAAVVTVPPREESQLGAARWTPDGDAILYSSNRDGAVVVKRRDLQSGEERPVMDVPKDASWGGRFETAPDGSIVYLERRPGGGAVIVRRPDGTKHEALRFASTNPITGATFWPDSHRLLLERESTARGTGERSTALWSLEEWGGTPRALGIEMIGLRMASVSPDRTRIAFTGGWPLREPWVLEHFQSRLPARTAPVQGARP